MQNFENFQKFLEIFGQIFLQKLEIRAAQNYANLVDLEKCCKMTIWLPKSALIQPRTSLTSGVMCRGDAHSHESRSSSADFVDAVQQAVVHHGHGPAAAGPLPVVSERFADLRSGAADTSRKMRKFIKMLSFERYKSV